jgi:KaiC/GvpD/RAD55 family RecA-like ATPase
MANRMLDRLRAKDKKGLFTKTQTAISYPTGFINLDYRNGYMVQVRDMYDQLVKEYASTGLVGGSFITIVGKSGTAKTTAAVQWASNIVRPFDSSFVLHFDLEQALTYTRIRNINGMSSQQLDDKYVLKQESTYIEDIFEAVADVANDKKEHFDDYSYDTGLVNEFNQPIRALEPTVMILDSIPTVASNDKKLEMEGGTYANRVAKALAQFYKRLTPIIKEANIIFIAINHINQKIEINPMMKTQPQLIYMKMDESMPGGNAPIYYAHNLFKFVTAGKKKMEDDGFDGFMVRCELMKSRTNKAGQFANLVYNQDLGFDPVLTQYDFANDMGLVEGRNPYRYITDSKDIKFDSRKFRKEFLENEALRYALFDKTLPVLERQLSRVDPTETAAAIHHMDVVNRLLMAQDRDGEFETVA